MKRINEILTGIGLLFFMSCSSEDTMKRVGFMENIKVFAEFEMKKDYDKLMQDEMQAESHLLDSLSILLNNEEGKEDTLRSFKLRKDYYVADQLFNTKYEQLSTKYTAEVNNRLNTYIKEFSKEKGYSLVLGSGGQGNVMYVDDDKNITDELIKYINKKYSN